MDIISLCKERYNYALFSINNTPSKKIINKRYLPIVSGIIGGLLGLLMYVLKIEIMPSKDIISAMAIGIISGLASTGTDQIKKQLNKNKGENKNGE